MPALSGPLLMVVVLATCGVPDVGGTVLARLMALVPFTSGSRREPLIDGQTMPSSFGLDGQRSPPKCSWRSWLSTDLEARTRLLPHPVGCGNAGQLGMMSWDGLSARGTRGHRPSASREMGLELQGRP